MDGRGQSLILSGSVGVSTEDVDSPEVRWTVELLLRIE